MHRIPLICIAALLCIMMIVVPVAAKTWYVDDDGGKDFATIDAAIAAASPGDTISVATGTYQYVEGGTDLEVTKPYLKIIGEGADVTTIDLGPRQGITMPASYTGADATGTVLDGFTIRNVGGSGLRIGTYGATSDVIIRNCNFRNISAYIEAGEESTDNILFENNTIELVGDDAGLYWKGNHFTFRNNTIKNSVNRYGTIEAMGPNAIVESNTFTGIVPPALVISYADNTTFSNNHIVGDSAEGDIGLSEAGSPVIYGNDLIDASFQKIWDWSGEFTGLFVSPAPVTYTYNGNTYTKVIGNYWGSAYTGTDADGDGIGDTPYVITGIGTDTAPLMQPVANYFGSDSTPSAPVAAFSGTPTSGTAPLTVQFTDASTNTPTSWSWDFGDSNAANATVKNPVHTYSTAGTYTVKLTATNSAGSNTVTKTDYVTVTAGNAPIQAAFSGTPAAGPAPLTVQFTDASTSSGSTADHVTNGGFESGSSGWTLSDSEWSVQSGTVHSGVKALYHGESDSASLTQTVNLTGVSTLTFWYWMTPIEGNPQFTCMIDGEQKHVDETTTGWTQVTIDTSSYSGPHTVSLIMSDGAGEIYVDDISAVGPGSITEWLWDFGDGSTSTVQSPTHIYTANGTYTVSLTVTGPEGTSTATKAGYITVSLSGTALFAAFSGTPTSGTAPLTVQFTDASTGNVTEWSWEFGDGSPSAVQNPSHTYTSAGTYSVSLTVTGPEGNNTVTKTNYITVGTLMVPVAAFSGTPVSGTAPLSVQFTDASTNSPAEWHWDFGDGSTSATRNPQHTYGSTGNYTVSLTATNAAGSDTVTKAGYISVAPEVYAPVAEFSANTTSGAAPLTVQFTDASTNTPISWAWDFGDNSTSTEQNPVHIYSSAGTYTITLTVTNSAGSNTFRWTNYITAISTVVALPGQTPPPTDPNGDGLYEDLNGDGEIEFPDLQLYFVQMDWIASNEPLAAFDYSRNGDIDFPDLQALFAKI